LERKQKTRDENGWKQNPHIFASSIAGVVSLPCGMMILIAMHFRGSKMVELMINSEISEPKTAYLRGSA